MSKGKASLLMMLTAAVTSAMLMGGPEQERLMLQTAVVQPGELVRSELVSGVVSYAQVQPCVSLKDARVSAVHVQAGQRVESGDLLFSLDTAAEEAALTALYQEAYERKILASRSDEPVSALADYWSRDWFEKELALKAAVESSVIRASHSGVVEAVYVKEGEFALKDALLGVVRGEDKCIVASGAADVWTGILPGTAALVFDETGKEEAAALQFLLAPADNQQSAVFELHPEQLADWTVGQPVTVEVLFHSIPAQALIPLAAVDEQNRCWYVENGIVECAEVNTNIRSVDYAAEGAQWAGRRLVLEPDLEKIYEGMKVSEAVDP